MAIGDVSVQLPATVELKKNIITHFTHFWAILRLWGSFWGPLRVLLPHHPPELGCQHPMAMSNVSVQLPATAELKKKDFYLFFPFLGHFDPLGVF